MDVTSSAPAPTAMPPKAVPLPWENIDSQEFREWVLSKYATSRLDANGSFELFRTLQSCVRSIDVVGQINVWRKLLSLIRADNLSKYQQLHKGEPFYWMALAAFRAHDFEGAVYYMDCALAEDLRNRFNSWQTDPAGLFVMLDDSREEQAGLQTVAAIRKVFETTAATVSSRFNVSLSLADFRRFVTHATRSNEKLRSVVTAFLSFLLEFQDRQWQLSIAPDHATVSSTAEPFLVHLFKGCVIFETLLKHAPGTSVGPTDTLGTLLGNSLIYRPLGAQRAIEGLGSHHTFDDFIQTLTQKRNDGTMGPFQDIRVTYGLRNILGHNLALPRRPTIDEYDEFFKWIFAAIARVMQKLY